MSQDTPFTPPGFQRKAFHCPHCKAYSAMEWTALTYPSQFVKSRPSHLKTAPVFKCTCQHCSQSSYWLFEEKKLADQWTDFYKNNPITSQPKFDELEAQSGKMIHPPLSTAPHHHPKLPPDLIPDYNEAREILDKSPRGAAALLRLVVQKLCIHLGKKGKNINDDIQRLVADGLPEQVQQALDSVRVIGNNAVHPGEIQPDDIKEVADTLFECVNYIVEDRIARPERISGLFKGLPLGALEGIEKRDGKKG